MTPRSLVDRVFYAKLLLALAGAIFTAAPALGAAGPARLVKDINTTLSLAIGSFPSDFTVLGETTLFRASTSTTGEELWRTDGTEAGTVLVKDILAGRGGALQAPVSGPENFLITAGNTLFFLANDGVHGYGLWRSDGTEAGTFFLRDVFAASSFGTFDLRHAHAGAGGILYFVANDPAYGQELWRSDGTEAGTFMLGDIRPGPSGSFPDTFTGGAPLRMAGVGDVMYFRADDGSHGPELWRTDGTVQGTRMVGDIWPGPVGSSPDGFAEQGGILLFSASGLTASGPGAGVELWASDGTAAGTRLVKDLLPGSSGSFPQQLTGVAGATYFLSSMSFSTSKILWRTDGTAGGTIMLGQFSSSDVNLLKVFDDSLIFSALDGAHGRELWKSDGTVQGTLMIKDIQPGAGSSLANLSLVEHEGTLYFGADDGTHGQELWKSDGTADGTALVADITPGSAGSDLLRMTPGNGALFFMIGPFLWRTDGTEAGTSRLSDLTIERLAVAADGALLFVTDDGLHGYELWRSDGTTSGTALLKDVNPLIRTEGGVFSVLGAVDLPEVGERVFLTAADDQHGSELWVTDGTADGTRLVRDILSGPDGSNPVFPVALNGSLYFSAEDGTHGRELWKSDGTEAGTQLVADIFPGLGGSGPFRLLVLNGRLYFTASDNLRGMELWTSDGTEAGTAIVADVNPGPGFGVGDMLIAIGDTLYFEANDGVHGSELWKTDGTEAGTSLVADIIPGPADACCGRMAELGGRLFMTARVPTHGFEPWISDGTEAGTFLVRDIFPGSQDSQMFAPQELNGSLLFSARDALHGRELWKSDGTEAGTVLVKDIRPGATAGMFPTAGMFIEAPARLGDRIYFHARALASGGAVLWTSDGTEDGTREVAPGLANSPSGLTAVQGALLYSATGTAIGQELWRSDGESTVLVQDIAPGVLSSSPASFTPFGRKILFLADDGFAGREAWVARAAILLNQPVRAVSDLIGEVRLLGLPKGTQTSLNAKLRAAARALSEGLVSDAIVSLEEFLNHVDVQTPRWISTEAAEGLTEFAREILALLEEDSQPSARRRGVDRRNGTGVDAGPDVRSDGQPADPAPYLEPGGGSRTPSSR